MTAPAIPPRPALHLLFCPLMPPPSVARLRAWTSARLSAEDNAHTGRFTDPEAARARPLARALLLLACRPLCPALPAALAATPSGAPVFRPVPGDALPPGMGAAVSFAYSPRAAVCGLALGPEGLRLGVDLEAAGAPPPAPRAFHDSECAAPPDEALRRWTVKEALLKAWGTGLAHDPACVPAGRRGQRRGRSSAPVPALPPLFWRSLPLPGHWCSLAISHRLPLRLSCLTAAAVAVAVRRS